MCQSCSALMINGVLCHEFGCPDSWIGKSIECENCGCFFIPEEKNQKFCGHVCYVNYNGVECNCEDCWQGYPEQDID